MDSVSAVGSARYMMVFPLVLQPYIAISAEDDKSSISLLKVSSTESASHVSLRIDTKIGYITTVLK